MQKGGIHDVSYGMGEDKGVLNGSRNDAMEDTMIFNFAPKFVHKSC